MSRISKYRGYDTDAKVWRYGFYMQKDDTILCCATEEQAKANEHHLILFGGFCDWNLPRPYYQSEVDGNSVGQYIGIEDKNGKEIYEGDILKHSNRIYEITYYAPFAMYMLKAVKGGGINGTVIQIRDCEVIGNVYENPELLEV